MGVVLCCGCLAVRPEASFALRLRCYRLAAGLTQKELEQAAGLAAGRVNAFEEGAAKPHASTRARLAKVLRSPDLERFGVRGE